MKPTTACLALSCLLASLAAAQNESNPIITRSDPQDWRMTTTVFVGGGAGTPAKAVVARPSGGPGAKPVEIAEDLLLDPNEALGAFSLEEATVYFPVAGRSASYEVDRESLKARFILEGRELPLRSTLYRSDASGQPVHSGGAYGIWSFGPIERFVGNTSLTFEFRARAWNTRFDEQAARQIAWPEGDWPAEAASTLDPMLFIDHGFEEPYDPMPIETLVERWTGGKAKSQPPVVVAKWLAGEVAKGFQPEIGFGAPDGVAADGYQPGRSLGTIQAINVTGAQVAAERMAGSPMDMVLLLTALYREAGLPARIVVGYVAGDEGGRRDVRRGNDEPELGPYAWVEFALYDETQSSLDTSLTWVPVDILAMRAGNVGRRPFEQHWDGFGSGEYFNELVPLAYHLHPHRLPAVSYGRSTEVFYQQACSVAYQPLPSLWGWNIVPFTPPTQHQALGFDVTTPSTTAEDQRRERAGGNR